LCIYRYIHATALCVFNFALHLSETFAFRKTFSLFRSIWAEKCLQVKHLPPGKTRYPLYRRLGGPQGQSGQAENLVPTGIRSRTVQPPVAQSLYRLSYRAHTKNSILNETNYSIERIGTMGTCGQCLNSLCCMAAGRL